MKQDIFFKDVYQFYFVFNINLFSSSLFMWMRHVDDTDQRNILIYLPVLGFDKNCFLTPNLEKQYIFVIVCHIYHTRNIIGIL